MTVSIGIAGEQAVYQNIRTILFSEKGSCVLMPNMGIGSLLLGVNSKEELSKLIFEQLSEYEPRMKIKSVQVTDNSTVGQYVVRLTYNIEGYGDEEFGFFEPI
jgi:phage baseplate assembly protein W